MIFTNTEENKEDESKNLIKKEDKKDEDEESVDLSR